MYGVCIPKTFLLEKYQANLIDFSPVENREVAEKCDEQSSSLLFIFDVELWVETQLDMWLKLNDTHKDACATIAR